MTFNYSLLNNLLPANAELNRSSYETDFPERLNTITEIIIDWYNLRYSFDYDLRKNRSWFLNSGYSNNYKTNAMSIKLQVIQIEMIIDFMNLTEDNYWKSFQVDSTFLQIQ